MLIVFDDDPQFRSAFSELFPKMGIDMEVIECCTKEEMRAKINNSELMKKVKLLVFDLSETSVEAETMEFGILEDIKRNYEAYAIPIFIHSAFAEKVDVSNNLGTLFKVKKGAQSIGTILDKMQLFYTSGFLNLFSPGGALETDIHREIQKAFINQFKGEEIASIIQSIQNSTKEEEFAKRVKAVFERIAIRALYQNMLSAKKQGDSENIQEIKINAVEHYYRRISEFPVWTGDIFTNKTFKQEIIILTPRCDINNGNCQDKYLVCTIDELEEKKIKEFGKDPKKVGDYINDNPQNTGIKFRYLLSAPSYKGGKINLTNYFIVDKIQLDGDQSEYEYLISLSDELTNDVVRKFGNYIMRGGISASDLDEASYYFKNGGNESKQ